MNFQIYFIFFKVNLTLNAWVLSLQKLFFLNDHIMNSRIMAFVWQSNRNVHEHFLFNSLMNVCWATAVLSLIVAAL